MKMKSILLVMMTLCLVICLCACGGSSDNDATQTTSKNDTTTTSTTTTTTATTTTTTTVAEGKVTYTVKVTDEGGNPISGAMVQLCLDSCVPCITNEQGIATYANMTEADYKVTFTIVPEGYAPDTTEYHFDEGSYELTLVLKAVA